MVVVVPRVFSAEYFPGNEVEVSFQKVFCSGFITCEVKVADEGGKQEISPCFGPFFRLGIVRFGIHDRLRVKHGLRLAIRGRRRKGAR